MLHNEVPFNERGGTLRGCLDLISGRFPRFVFGGSIDHRTLPVFHFHDVIAGELDPKLRYLAENGYRTVTCDEIASFVAGRTPATDRAVALCFDDAWASLWTVAAPLLRQFGQTGIVYAIPGRIERPGSPFVTWNQLRELGNAGILDVQCHTFSHSRIFCSARLAGFVTPAYASVPFLNRPQLAPPPHLTFLTERALGAPLYPARSRMSDGRRVWVAADVHARCVEHVQMAGGAPFFSRPGWHKELEAIARDAGPRVESEADQRKAIEEELDNGRALLNDRLGTNTVNHVCLPWGVSGRQTSEALRRLGFRTAFANRLRGLHAVRKGDDPFWLKRLPNQYISRLPGRGRRAWL